MATIYFSIEGIFGGKKKSPNKNFKFLRQKRFKNWFNEKKIQTSLGNLKERLERSKDNNILLLCINL